MRSTDRTIKLWKVRDRRLRQISRMQHDVTALRPAIPHLVSTGSIVTASARRVFSNAHAYMINAISVNSDGETFLSSDDLRINWWSLEINDRSFSKSCACVSAIPFAQVKRFLCQIL
jgi:serine/threonine-protein phosphatase 2A regulatory subunit B